MTVCESCGADDRMPRRPRVDEDTHLCRSCEAEEHAKNEEAWRDV